MKNNLLQKCLVILFLISSPEIFSQTPPKLQLSGTRPSFALGTINTDILTEIIQEKQEEVKKKVFYNTIVKSFNKLDYTQDLNNFTTYNYLYGVMDVLTSNKNKTVITKSIIGKSAEFGYVFGLAWLASQNELFIDSLSGQTTFSLEQLKGFSDSLKDISHPLTKVPSGTRDTLEGKVERFNIIIDMCYDILLKDNLQTDFEFERTLSEPAFEEWYNQENVYIDAFPKDVAKYEKMRRVYKARLILLLDVINGVRSGTVVNTALESHPQINLAYQEITKLIKDLQKHKYKEFAITPDQFEGLKYSIYTLVDFVKNETESDVVSTVLNFMLENTFLDYVNDKDILQVDSISNKGGYITIDVESLIASIYDKFAGATRNGIGVYFQPYISIGTSTVYFPKTNTLGINADGTTRSIDNLYFASEKIGFKWLICNNKYRNSHSAGLWYKYYGRWCQFNTQPKSPLLNNFYLSAYASGLLYQIAILNSDDSFHFPIFGVNGGVTFFNGLSFSVGWGYVWQNNYNKNENHFYSASIDIPIIDYLSALKKKK